MRTMSSPTIALCILQPLFVLLLSVPLAHAEVYKCTTAEGKTSYSEKPCAVDGAKEVLVPIKAPPPPSAPGRNRSAENATANARAQAAGAVAASGSASKASAPAKSRQQIIAECEANHGVDCGSAPDLAARESDDRTLTPEEAAALQRAAAGARERAKAEAAAAAAAAKAKESGTPQPPTGSGATPPPAKKGK